MEELNVTLLLKCQNYLSHQIRGKKDTVGAMLLEEKKHLYPLLVHPFDPSKRTTSRVDRFCTIRFDTNNYSVPSMYCGREVSLKATPTQVFVYFEGQCIAEHPRCLDRRRTIYSLDHYLPLLEKKGRAIFYARPVQETFHSMATKTGTVSERIGGNFESLPR